MYEQTRTINGHEGAGGEKQSKTKILKTLFIHLIFKQQKFYQIHNNIEKNTLTYRSMFRQGQGFFSSNKSMFILIFCAF